MRSFIDENEDMTFIENRKKDTGGGVMMESECRNQMRGIDTGIGVAVAIDKATSRNYIPQNKENPSPRDLLKYTFGSKRESKPDASCPQI